jgi:hypothetical protein
LERGTGEASQRANYGHFTWWEMSEILALSEIILSSLTSPSWTVAFPELIGEGEAGVRRNANANDFLDV